MPLLRHGAPAASASQRVWEQAGRAGAAAARAWWCAAASVRRAAAAPAGNAAETALPLAAAAAAISAGRTDGASAVAPICAANPACPYPRRPEKPNPIAGAPTTRAPAPATGPRCLPARCARSSNYPADRSSAYHKSASAAGYLAGEACGRAAASARVAAQACWPPRCAAGESRTAPRPMRWTATPPRG